MARNREYMARLGIGTLASVVGGAGGKGKTATVTGVGRKRARGAAGASSGAGSDGPVRRSSRLQRVSPEHDGSAVDALDSDDDVEAKSKRAGGGGAKERFATGPAGMWASEDAALEASRHWLEDARALMGMRCAASTTPATNTQGIYNDAEQAGRHLHTPHSTRSHYFARGDTFRAPGTLTQTVR